MSAYRLELARRADATALAHMSARYVEHGLRAAWTAVRILWHIRDADSVVLTARTASAPAGFAIMRFGDERAHLNLLAVEPAHRRRGLGRALLTWLEDSALTAGTFTVSLELRAGNAGARAFYGALGYQECGEIPGYYQGVEAALRLRRDVRVRRATPGARRAAAED
ncbi:MAG TPA: GNAT family N-acetyltransferase [Steroidobacteraceae bacterium]|nr:GNAT family N-acetyltransferase [Steroidobacteraceae bacterium]